MAARWDGDDRGQGNADAAQLVAGAGELLAAFRQPTWVAEQPEIHLLPHVEAWCETDGRLVLTGAYTEETNAYILDLEWRGTTRSVGGTRAAVFSLIGSFAESATYVRQRRIASNGDGTAMQLQFEVGTGRAWSGREVRAPWPRGPDQRGQRVFRTSTVLTVTHYPRAAQLSTRGRTQTRIQILRAPGSCAWRRTLRPCIHKLAGVRAVGRGDERGEVAAGVAAGEEDARIDVPIVTCVREPTLRFSSLPLMSAGTR